MQKLFILMLALAFGLSACSGSQATQAAQPADQSAQINPGSAVSTDNPTTQNPTQGATGNSTVDEQLAAGTLRLEGTVLAVNAGQAKELLPLWQQVLSLSTDGSNTTQDQIQAVYQQIQDVMTTEQIQAIEGMNWDQTDLQSLMSDLGLQATPGAGPNPGGGQMATPGAGGMGPGGTGTPPDFLGTPGPGGSFGGRGMGNLFVEPLIALLQQRAGS